MEFCPKTADRRDVRILRSILILLFSAVACVNGFAYRILYAEQFYRLYHTHLIQYPEDITENIVYLEMALKTPFVNPLNALARIENEEQWERYRYLFAMHVNLEILRQYRLLASKFDKRNAYFFNYPWKEDNLKSLEIAEHYYRTAMHYWEEALSWREKAAAVRYHHFEEVQYWEDEAERIASGELDYRAILETDLERLARVRREFEAMGEDTY
jgi:hypothetical protein